MQSPNGSFTPSLLLAGGLLIVSVLTITQLKDPQFTPLPQGEGQGVREL